MVKRPPWGRQAGILPPPLHPQPLRCQRPGVHSALVNHNIRRWESRVGECPHGDGDEIGCPVHLPIDGRTAGWTEMEGGGAAAVALADPGAGAACDAHMVAREPGLGAKDAAGAFLALQAVAHGYPPRLPRAGQVQLAATA